jgi:hypothetical protein
MRTYLEKTHHKKGIVEWLKMKALSSNLSIGKKKKAKRETASGLLVRVCLEILLLNSIF